jgi:predicted ATPase
MGKTRLALAVADAVNAGADSGAGSGDGSGDDQDGRTADGSAPRAVVVPLSTVAGDDELLVSICQAIGAEPDWSGQPLFDTIVRSLSGQVTVLVLDNFEQLIDTPGTLEDVMALLDQLPGLTVVCTSRVALRLGRERQVVLGPLSLPVRVDDDLDAILDADAVKLFQDRAASVVPGFQVTSRNASAVAQICRLLDGQPLALELAAARTRMMPPEEMVGHAGQLLALLSGGGRDLPERQRSMRAVLDWSAQLLDPAEADVFAQVSVFAGGWTVNAADRIVESPEPVFEVLARLVDKSLVVAGTDGRLLMLETVREYAAERLTALGPDRQTAVRNRHAAYYAELASDLGPQFRTSPNPDSRAPLDAEMGNFAEALAWSSKSGAAAVLGRMVFGLVDYWFFNGRIAHAERWVNIANAAELPPEVRIRLSLSTGRIAFVQGDVASAAPALERSATEAREFGDRLLLTRSLTMSSLAARHAGNLELALERIDEAIAVARSGASTPEDAEQLEGLGFVLGNERGEVLEGLGRTDEARAHFEAYRQQSLAGGDHSNLAWALGNLAMNECQRGHWGPARELADTAVREADEGASAQVMADARTVAGLVELQGGDPARAIAALDESVRLTHAAGQLLTLPDGVSLLGAALLQAGDAPGAARMLSAGQAWRSARGLVVIGRLAQQTIEQAHEELAALPLSQAVKAESARGAAVPYGWIEALELPGSMDLRTTDAGRVLHLVERDDTEQADAAAARAAHGSRD